jgi:hypothetical protein
MPMRRFRTCWVSLYAGVVAINYLVPTISAIKSYYLGGMFYGTFLLFTLIVLSLFFESLEETIRVRGYRAVLVKFANWSGCCLLR